MSWVSTWYYAAAPDTAAPDTEPGCLEEAARAGFVCCLHAARLIASLRPPTDGFAISSGRKDSPGIQGDQKASKIC